MPEATFSDMMSCTIGTTALVLTGFSAHQEAVASAGKGRTGTKTSCKGEGYLEGTSAADFAAKLQAAYANLAASGQDVIVRGLSGAILWRMSAASFLDQGPHIKFDAQPGPTPLRMDFEWEAWGDNAQTDGSGGGNPQLNSFDLTIKTGPDGLRQVTQTGEVNYANGPALFLVQVLPAFQASYPPPTWWIESQYKTGGTAAASKLTYQATAHETYGPLPTAGAGVAVQGRWTIRTERDEQQRQTLVYDLDLTVAGDAAALVADIRQRLAGAVGLGHQVPGAGPTQPIYRESVSIETIEANHITASFTVLRSASGTPLMDFTESVSAEEGQLTSYEVKQYPGVDPVILQKPKGVQKVTQEGNATCQQVFIKPGPSIYGQARLEPDQVTFADVDAVQKRTTWRYVTFTAGAQLVPVETIFESLFKPTFIDRPSLDQQPGSFYQPRAGTL